MERPWRDYSSRSKCNDVSSLNQSAALAEVYRGYKDNPEATASSKIENEWLTTGDLGYIDDKGFLVIFDRLKDIIKYNGYV